MRKLLLGAAVGCVLALGTGGATAAECSGTISADEALKGEDARYAAQTTGDFAAMQRLFGDDLLYTHSSGKTDNKASYIELQRSESVIYRSMQRSDVTVRTYGCIAIISGNAHYQVTVGGKDITPELVFHSIWAKRDGGVQFVSWQSTAAPKP
jgi:Domain of unknown function (DUF4440)